MTKRCSSAYRSWTNRASRCCSRPGRKPPRRRLPPSAERQTAERAKDRDSSADIPPGHHSVFPDPGGDMPSEEEARIVAPRNARFWAYLGIVTAAGLTLIASSLMRLTAHDFLILGGAFLV